MSESNYERLAKINVNEHCEKKGELTYLSWVWAIDRLLREDPDARWEYAPIQYFPDRTAMIYCTVTAFGKDRTMQLPVMDYRMRAIAEPDAFAINTTMQRCFVKACALHGLGLYIYAGEDLPPGEEANSRNSAAPPADVEPPPPPPPAPRKMKPKDFQSHCTAMAQATKITTLQKAYTDAVLAARGLGDEDAVLSFQRKKDELKEMINAAHARELASQP